MYAAFNSDRVATTMSLLGKECRLFTVIPRIQIALCCTQREFCLMEEGS